MQATENPYYAALRTIVYDWGVIDGHHDLHHDGNAGRCAPTVSFADHGTGDDLAKALHEMQVYCPGLPPQEQHELAQLYTSGYHTARDAE